MALNGKKCHDENMSHFACLLTDNALSGHQIETSVAANLRHALCVSPER
jgi:hypothetical protein